MNIHFLVLVTVFLQANGYSLRNTIKSRLKRNCDCVCGTIGRKARIAGGNEVLPNQFPWTVGLSYNGKIYCGASLISHNFLLTASHCVDSFDASSLRAYVGVHNISKDFTEIKRIKRIITHENYNIIDKNNDIALLEMESPIFYGPKTQPICLPDGSEQDFTNTLTVVAGWGSLSSTSKKKPLALHAVTVPIWSRDRCLLSGYDSSKISENMMCGGYPQGRRDSCHGDSGGPMMAEGPTGSIELVGVVSWGRDCGRKNFPGIYTKVVNYLPWIHEHLQDECLCKPKQGVRTNLIEELFDEWTK